MAKHKTHPKDNGSNQQNPNKGTAGVNKAFQQAQSNKANQKTQTATNKKK